MKIYLTRAKGLISRSHYFLLAMVLAGAAILGNISVPDSAHAAVGTITGYSIPNSPFYPRDLALGPDNKIWHTGYQRVSNLTTAGSFTQHTRGVSNYGFGITTGSDGNIWFGEQYTVASTHYGRIVKMATDGTVLDQYNIPSGKNATTMTLGPDDAVWFTEANSGIIGKITTSGVITEYSANMTVTDITTGPDGNLWFTFGTMGASYGNGVGKITTSGIVTAYSILPTNGHAPYPQSITTGPDGNLWFTEKEVNKIGKITTSGVITEYNLPTADSKPYGITTGSDGALWFTASNTSKIGRITTAGVVTDEYSVAATPAGSLQHIIAGPDGAVWFTNYFGNKIGRLATELTSQTISFSSTGPTDAVIDGPTYTPVASATSGLLVTITVDSSASSVCSIDGAGKVSFQGAGTCVINADQAGDADYNPAAQVQQSFAVLPVDADTSVSLDCHATAPVDSTVTCTITVANDGPAAAKSATLTALFPDLLTGASLSGGGTLSGQSITWTTPSLASGASATLTFSATASVAGKVYFNAALLQASPDPDNSNNIDSATIKAS